MHRSGRAESYGNYICRFWGTSHWFPQWFYQWWVTSPPPILISTILTSSNFNLHFPKDLGCWTFPQIFISHLYFVFWKLSIYWLDGPDCGGMELQSSLNCMGPICPLFFKTETRGKADHGSNLSRLVHRIHVRDVLRFWLMDGLLEV